MNPRERTPDLEILIRDQVLPLEHLEPLITDYTNIEAGTVRTTNRWGGPAAGGLGGVEIAVIIVVTALLQMTTRDLYELVKGHIVAFYRGVKADTGARTYSDGLLALLVEGSPSLQFCIPAGLTEAGILERFRSVEENWERLAAEWAEKARDYDAPISLCMDEETGDWIECGDYGYGS
ncbi:MAG: hypothetical protein OXS47_00270 [Chloroflexota bacterium]|nr:hypothetical protein [Chloroflexota bacterium]